MVTETEFRQVIANNIASTIRSLKKNGVTGIGIECLMQVTATPKLNYNCNPDGYRVIFEEVARSIPVAKKFLIEK